MDRKIGVLDSGIGGLSVVASLQNVLPNEDILYFGDSKNVPYGNKGEEEILSLTTKIFDFLEKEDVKLIIVACNTISALLEKHKNYFGFPTINIINPTVEYIARSKLDDLAFLGTEFTIKSGVYQRLSKERNMNTNIIADSSRNLATFIDSGDFMSPEIRGLIKSHIDSLIKKGAQNIALVCTHYLIVYDIFLDLFPKMNFIDPGYHQALATRDYLLKNNLSSAHSSGTLTIYTSGEKETYEKAAKKLYLHNLDELSAIQL
ncbi:MAG: glutamate racemase [Clostridiales bacterium]|nr:glutamate racemase [Clostridiales bacterium]